MMKEKRAKPTSRMTWVGLGWPFASFGSASYRRTVPYGIAPAYLHPSGLLHLCCRHGPYRVFSWEGEG